MDSTRSNPLLAFEVTAQAEEEPDYGTAADPAWDNLCAYYLKKVAAGDYTDTGSKKDKDRTNWLKAKLSGWTQQQNRNLQQRFGRRLAEPFRRRVLEDAKVVGQSARANKMLQTSALAEMTTVTESFPHASNAQFDVLNPQFYPPGADAFTPPIHTFPAYYHPRPSAQYGKSSYNPHPLSHPYEFQYHQLPYAYDPRSYNNNPQCPVPPPTQQLSIPTEDSIGHNFNSSAYPSISYSVGTAGSNSTIDSTSCSIDGADILARVAKLEALLEKSKQKVKTAAQQLREKNRLLKQVAPPQPTRTSTRERKPSRKLREREESPAAIATMSPPRVTKRADTKCTPRKAIKSKEPTPDMEVQFRIQSTVPATEQFGRFIVDGNDGWFYFACDHRIRAKLVEGKLTRGGKTVRALHDINCADGCPVCRSVVTFTKDLYDRQNELIMFLKRIRNTAPAVSWEENGTHLDPVTIADLLGKNLEQLNLCKKVQKRLQEDGQDLFEFLGQSIEVVEIEQEYCIKDHAVLENLQYKLKHAKYSPALSKAECAELFNDKHKLAPPTGHKIGLVKWERLDGKGYNYATLEDLEGIDDDCILQHAYMGAFYKLEGDKGSNKFSRYGIHAHIPGDRNFDPLALQGRATSNKGITHADKHGKQLQHIYASERKGGQLARVDAVKGDVIGKKFNLTEKRNLLQGSRWSEALRTRSIARGKSRLKTLAIIAAQKLDAGSVAALCRSFKKAILSALVPKTWTTWTNIDNSLSLFDVILLEWDCSDESSLAFESIEAHVDGKNKTFESLDLHGIGIDGCDVESLVKGFTTLPLLALHLLFDPTKTQVFAQFDATIHIGDPTRYEINYAHASGYPRRLTDNELNELEQAANEAGIPVWLLHPPQA